MTLSWQDGDAIFERLTECTAGLDDSQLAAFLARLVFLLADAVDDEQTAARRCVGNRDVIEQDARRRGRDRHFVAGRQCNALRSIKKTI